MSKEFYRHFEVQLLREKQRRKTVWRQGIQMPAVLGGDLNRTLSRTSCSSRIIEPPRNTGETELEARLLMPTVSSTSRDMESVWPCFQLTFVSVTGAVSHLLAYNYGIWVGYLV